MASGTISPLSVVIDANVVIAICAKEADKLANAEAKIKEYSTNGCAFYAPGVIVAMWVSKFVVSNANTSAESSNRATAAFAIAICACSNCLSVTCRATR